MQCLCGGEATPRSHQVETDSGAARWTAMHTPRELPLTVMQWRCDGCGRERHEVYNARGKRIERHG